MKQISAPLRFVCPNCTSPLPTRPWRRLPGWRGIVLAIVHRAFYRRGRVSIGTRLFGDAESGFGENTDNGN